MKEIEGVIIDTWRNYYMMIYDMQLFKLNMKYIYLQKYRMQKGSNLTEEEIDEIIRANVLQQISVQDLINKKISSNSNLMVELIMKSLKEKVRNFVLDLEKSLWMVEKICELKIYDHDSDLLFDYFLASLGEIVPQSARTQFYQLYKNTALKSVQIIWQVENVFVHSEKKMEIYDSLLSFATKHDLFKKSRLEKRDPTEDNPPYENIEKLFPLRDLQLILRIFKQAKCDPMMTFKKLKQLGLTGPQYEDEKQFVYRVDNLFLIGLFEYHKKICLIQKVYADKWANFINRKLQNMDFSPFLESLAKAAIRKDCNQIELQKIRLILSKQKIRRIKIESEKYQNKNNKA